jgi:hypothetical protein
MTNRGLEIAALCGAAVLLGAASPARAQGNDAQENEVTIEASVVRGAVGYARHSSPTTLLGIEAGFGFPQIDLTLTPTDEDPEGEPEFEEYLHVALFARLKPSGRFEVDAGVRGSIADVWACTASDCWPALFGGAYVQPMIGGTRFKVGARLTAGWIAESMEGGPEEATFVVGVAPLLATADYSMVVGE